jgi:hypothetical protein
LWPAPAAAAGGDPNQHREHQSRKHDNNGEQGNGQQGNDQQGNDQQGNGRNMGCPTDFELVSTRHVHVWTMGSQMVVGNMHDRNGDGKLCAGEIGHNKHVGKGTIDTRH